MKTKLQILIVEPSEIITQGLVAILQKHDFEVCGTAENTANLEMLLEEKSPDVLIINPLLNAPNNSTTLHAFLSRKSISNIFALIYQYVPNNILKNYTKQIDIHNDTKEILSLFEELKNDNDDTNNENYELTSRETDVLTLMVKGLLNKEIADKLNISIHTVITHRKNIVRKTGIKTVAGLTVYAMLNNLMD
ncbi:MAG: response regulator transcription factor [Paludibacteraceae bacterium]|nr:response regulator transcription factor [Paludibacteraceae bacterium]